MNTSKPLSAISYNSKEFLVGALNRCLNSHKIEFWAFIKHNAEEDELKDHIHVYFEPAKRLQTELLKDDFKEFDSKHPDKPLCIIHPVLSKFGDWYLYCQHDRAYLAKKGQKREFVYDSSEFVVSDRDEFLDRVRNIDNSEGDAFGQLIDYFDSGLSFSDLIRQGLIPVGKISAYNVAWQVLVGANPVYRNGRHSHTEKGKL